MQPCWQQIKRWVWPVTIKTNVSTLRDTSNKSNSTAKVQRRGHRWPSAWGQDNKWLDVEVLKSCHPTVWVTTLPQRKPPSDVRNHYSMDGTWAQAILSLSPSSVVMRSFRLTNADAIVIQLINRHCVSTFTRNSKRFGNVGETLTARVVSQFKLVNESTRHFSGTVYGTEDSEAESPWN